MDNDPGDEAVANVKTATAARLHHNAYVTQDQEATRAFYEDLIGLPLVATWCETDELFGPAMPDTPFSHIALKVDAAEQDAVAERLAAAGYEEPVTFVLEHGYCRSLYVKDPNGLLLELTADHPDAEAINATRQTTAREDLARWLAGDHTSNNTYR